jgi:hypothetical protein
MTFIIKNPHDHAVKVGLTTVEPRQQLTMQHLTNDINDALDKGDIIISGSGDPTLEELKADAEALKPFKTGDPAIDG